MASNYMAAMPPAATSMPVVANVGGGVPASVIQPAEVVPLPIEAMHALEGATAGGFMAKFQVHFPRTGNDNPARRITSAEHTDAQGWTWRLVLHPWGHEERGCYSAFLELMNSDALPPGFSRYVKLEFAMHAWDAAYPAPPNKTQFLLHKFNAQATDFGYSRAFEHEDVMAQRNKFIDPQGFVRISVKIIDVREAYFRVATDADLGRSVTGRAGGGDFADWGSCLPAKSFKHDQLLYVIQKVSELTAVPLVSCRPWLCMPRPGGAIRPVAALLPQHLHMSICEALGDRGQYYIYLEEVDSLPDVWNRRRSIQGELPAVEAGELLLSGRAYAQLPNEVYLVFLKMDKRIMTAYANGENPPTDVVPTSGEPEFEFIGKAMAHKSDRGSELVPIARSLANLPDNVGLEVFEQLAPEEVRRFSSDKTVEQAGLAHGSVLLFRSAHLPGPPPPVPVVPVASTSSVVPFNPAAVAAAASAAASIAATATAAVAASAASAAESAAAAATGSGKAPDIAPGGSSTVVSANNATTTTSAADNNKTSVSVPPATTGAEVVAAGRVAAVEGASSSGAADPSSSHGGEDAVKVDGGSAGGGDGSSVAPAVAVTPVVVNAQAEGKEKEGKEDGEGCGKMGKADGVKDGGGSVGGVGGVGAPGWEGSAETAVADVGVAGAKPVVMDLETQRLATCLALYKVQEDAKQRQARGAATTAAKKLAAEANATAALDGKWNGAGAAATAANAKTEEGLGGSNKAAAADGGGAGAEDGVTSGSRRAGVAAAVEAAAAAIRGIPPRHTSFLTPEESATVAAAAEAAAAAAAAAHACRSLSITEALNVGAPSSASPSPPVGPSPLPLLLPRPAPAGGVVGFAKAMAALAGASGGGRGVPPAAAAVTAQAAAAAAVTAAVTTPAPTTVSASPGVAASGEDTESEKEGDTAGEAKPAALKKRAANKPTEPKSESEPSLSSSGKLDASFSVPVVHNYNANSNGGVVSGGGVESSINVSNGVATKKEEAAAAVGNPNALDVDVDGDGDAGTSATGVTTRETRAARASRSSSAASAAAAAAMTANGEATPEVPATAAAVVVVEQQRRSSRKAAAVASTQIRCAARAGSRNTGSGSPAPAMEENGNSCPPPSSAAASGLPLSPKRAAGNSVPVVEAAASSSSGGGAGGSCESAGGAANGGVGAGEVGPGGSKARSTSDRTSGEWKRPAEQEGGGPKKTAKLTGEDNGQATVAAAAAATAAPIEARQLFSVSEYAAFVSQLKDVPGFSMDMLAKTMQSIQNTEMVKALSKAKENNDQESVRLLGQIMSREEDSKQFGTE